jgi:hypothetical protein
VPYVAGLIFPIIFILIKTAFLVVAVAFTFLSIQMRTTATRGGSEESSEVVKTYTTEAEGC